MLGSPLNSLVWLANTVGARGITLEAGHVVLPGAVCAMAPVVAGDTFTATFAGPRQRHRPLRQGVTR